MQSRVTSFDRAIHSFRKSARYMLAVISLLVTSQSLGSENGGFGNYGIGVQTIAAGMLPPVGMTLFNAYAVNYRADRFLDDQGKELIPNFKADIHLQLIEIDPIHLGINIGDWHLQTATYVWLPLGNYDPADLAHSSQNYATVSQSMAVTWLPTPQWEVTLDANVSFNFRNSETDYRSGDLFGLTYSAGYRPFPSHPQWQLGINGLYVQQFNDDEIDDQKVPTGFRLRKLSAGPQAVYWFSPAVAAALKWQHEVHVRNGPKGDSIWLQAAFPTQFSAAEIMLSIVGMPYQCDAYQPSRVHIQAANGKHIDEHMGCPR